jgi:4-hydroxy-tetrahydrodipicolinate synthase
MNQSSWRQRLSGVFTALVTPMQNGALDIAAFERHVMAQLEAGVHGLVPVGTTGEAATLTKEETAQIIRRTVALAQGRAFVMAGAGSNATYATIDKVRHAADLGVNGLLIVTPYYNKPSQAGLFDHFAAVAAEVDLPIMLYNVPGRTGVELAVETAAKLALTYPNIVGIKEASGRSERVTELRLACGADFIIHSGDDALMLPFLALGADGVTSVASNLLPCELVALFDAWRAGKLDRARKLHENMYDLVRHLFIESNPVPVKAALAARGAMTSEVRAPLAPLQPSSQAALGDSLRRFGGLVL